MNDDYNQIKNTDKSNTSLILLLAKNGWGERSSATNFGLILIKTVAHENEIFPPACNTCYMAEEPLVPFWATD